MYTYRKDECKRPKAKGRYCAWDRAERVCDDQRDIFRQILRLLCEGLNAPTVLVTIETKVQGIGE